MNDSKEIIKNRMLKHALNYWGIRNAEDVDPVVKLILDAISNEMYNLGNEIAETQSRILEKIADLLSPDFLTLPTPAHAVLHAMPAEPSEWLTPASSFFMNKKIATRANEAPDSNVELNFTPVAPIKIFNARIAAICTPTNLYTYDEDYAKQLMARSRNRMTEENILWLGVTVNKEITELNGFGFYFDWKNLESGIAESLYKLLPLARWYVDSQELNIVQGLIYGDESASESPVSQLFSKHEPLKLMEEDVRQFYEPRFFTISTSSDKNLQEMLSTTPESFLQKFSPVELQKLSDPLIWVKIIMPAAIQADRLEDLNVYMNSFPVMNRKPNEIKYRLKGGSNIIPIKTDALELFLSVKSVSDEARAYRRVPYRDKQEEEVGSYTLRRGGVERFDARNAKEIIENLLELLRSENAAFSAYGYDFIASTLREVNQKIALMEQKTKGYINKGAEVPNYIITKPFEGFEVMYVQYWTTVAELANNLRSGTRLQLSRGAKVKNESIILMTTTVGAKNRLQAEEKVNALKYSILTRDRIVTKEDIRNFCFFELGSRISDVTVQLGLEMDKNIRQAFRRTVEILLVPSNNNALSNDEWDVITEMLLAKLKTRSGMSNHFRIKIAEPV